MVQAEPDARKSDQDAYIVLGFTEEPKNTLLTLPLFTPSKIGGRPAWICPEGVPDTSRCELCGTPLCFVGQIYANLDHLEDFHRMLYMFACVS